MTVKPLVSTVEVNSPDALEKLTTSATEAVSDGSILVSEVAGQIDGLIRALLSDADSEQSVNISELASNSPEVAAFVQKLQETIFNAKAATPQGLLLSAQLEQGAITQEQFRTAVDAIVVPASQLQAAIGVELPLQTQKLILALANNPNINVLAKLASNATPTNAPSAGRLNTDKTDVRLGNTRDFLADAIAIAARIAEQNLRASASSLLSLKPQPRIMSGARAVVYLNGKVAVLCNNVQYEISTDWSEIRGVDELIPNDLAPMAYSVKGSMSIYRVPNGSPISNFLHQDMFRGIVWPYTSIEIRDKRTDEIILQIKRAAITSRGEAYTKGQLTTTNLSFVAIGFRDEVKPELLLDRLPNESSGTDSLTDQFKSLTNAVKNLF